MEATVLLRDGAVGGTEGGERGGTQGQALGQVYEERILYVGICEREQVIIYIR